MKNEQTDYLELVTEAANKIEQMEGEVEEEIVDQIGPETMLKTLAVALKMMDDKYQNQFEEIREELNNIKDNI